eukprot:2456085-Amphidinium_carterae.1
MPVHLSGVMPQVIHGNIGAMCFGMAHPKLRKWAMLPAPHPALNRQCSLMAFAVQRPQYSSQTSLDVDQSKLQTSVEGFAKVLPMLILHQKNAMCSSVLVHAEGRTRQDTTS